MTRTIRKFISIVCAVALLMSLCAVSLIGTTKAILGPDDDMSVVYNHEPVVSYNFDSAPGIAYYRYVDALELKDGGLKIGNKNNGGGAWFAKDPTQSNMINHQGSSATNKQTAYDNLLRLDADTTYRVTFKYKYLAGSTTAGFNFLFAYDVTGLKDSTAPDYDPYSKKDLSNVTIKERDYTKVTVPAGGLTADTQYYNASYVFTVKDKSINLGLRAEMKTCNMVIDDLVIEKRTEQLKFNDIDKEYVFDYTDADNQAQLTARQEKIAQNSNKDLQHYSWYNWNGHLGSFAEGSANYDKYNKFVASESYPGKPGFTDEGAKFTVGKYATLVDNTSFGCWANNLPIYDPDVGNNDGYGNKGGYFVTKDNAVYLVTVKYKVTQLTGSRLQFGVAALHSNLSPVAGRGSVFPGCITTITSVSDGWQYYTAILDTNANPEFADRAITLTAATDSDTAWSTVIVDSVKIEEKRDTANGVAIMKYTNRGNVSYDMISAGNNMTLPVPENTNPDSAFAGWYTSADFDESTKVDMNGFTPLKGVNALYAKWVNTASVIVFNNQGMVTEQKLAVGLELPNPERPGAYLFFEGWYTDLDFTNKITTVPDYDTTVYAKYNGVYTGFNNIICPNGETTATPQLLPDPDDPTNQIVKFQSGKNTKPNFMIPHYDAVGAKGFELKTNTTYIITYRAKLTETSVCPVNADFIQGDRSGMSSTTTRTVISGTEAVISSDDWTYVTTTFTTGETFYLERVKWSYQNHIFFSIYNYSNPLSVYIDDICIAEALDEAPEGTVSITFNTNANEMLPMYGYSGETIPAISDPVLSGYKFVGWYTDKHFNEPFTALTFGTEDIELYAKWESVPMLVDFSDYDQGAKSERAEFKTDENGNDYLDWYVEHATNNKHDTGTAYRVFLNKAGTHQKVTTGAQYTISFKYKLLSGDVTVKPVTNGLLNGWASYKVHDEKIVLNEVSDDWAKASLTFTAAPEGGMYLSIGIAGHGHILVDDVVIEVAGNLANLYGSTAMFFNSNGGSIVDAISGDPGEDIGKLPVPTKTNYAFDRWYVDAELTTPFTDKLWGEEDLTLYAGWAIAKFNEGFEDYPGSVLAQGISGGYSIYKDSVESNDKANIQNGSASLYRNGTQTGNKAFTLSRSEDLCLTVGKQYTLTFYVKPETVNDASGTISLIGMDKHTAIVTPKDTNVITTVGELKAGEWQKVSYTFTATNKYVGISSTANNNMYLDNFTVTLKGYTGTATGDTSVNPMIIALMVILAAGALIVTGRKTFEK